LHRQACASCKTPLPCGALYFPPRDARLAAERIVELVQSRELWEQQIALGKARLSQFPEPGQRAGAYLELLRKMVR